MLEDTDLCRRYQQEGLGCAVVKDATILHYGGASSAGESGVRFKTMIGTYYTRAKYHYVRRAQGRASEFSVRLADLQLGLRLSIWPHAAGTSRAMGRLLLRESLRIRRA